MTRFGSLAVSVLLTLITPPVGNQYRIETGAQAGQAEGRIILTASHMSPLRAVLQLATENKLPLGISFGPQPLLCAKEHSFSINAGTIREAIAQSLVGTGYSVELKDGVFVLSAPDITIHERTLLDYRFDKFSATQSTMSGAGALLAGYIMTVAEGASGFAGSVPYGQSAERFNIVMYSATTTEIANRIVSEDGKGVWVFRPTRDAIPTSGNDTPIEVYSYRDNSEGIENLSCRGHAEHGE